MPIKKVINHFLNKLRHIKSSYQEGSKFRKNSYYPVAHYYSPIVSVEEVMKNTNQIWNGENIDGIAGINLNTESQIKLIEEDLCQFYNELPFLAEKQEGLRYYFDNKYYTYTDGIVLYAMMRSFKPKRIIEIGSGFSSAVMLDTNEIFFDNQIQLTFIEPYPDRLYSLINKSDEQSTQIIVKGIQAVNLEIFEELEENDILFIDSSHVVKTGSDVNQILFEILPRLKRGVLIHFHDIFYPFEYPKEWVYGGRNWNEDYFLKAFLMYNSEFEIKLFSHYIHQHHQKAFKKMPLAYKNTGGNLWLLKK
jgi:predicted O-methyltransferase YrrM